MNRDRATPLCQPRTGTAHVKRESVWLLPVGLHRIKLADLSLAEQDAIRSVIADLGGTPHHLDEIGAVFGMVVEPHEKWMMERGRAATVLLRVRDELVARKLFGLRVKVAPVEPPRGECAVCESVRPTVRIHVPAAREIGESCESCIGTLVNIAETFIVRGPKGASR